jgi:hypothetical protein
MKVRGARRDPSAAGVVHTFLSKLDKVSANGATSYTETTTYRKPARLGLVGPARKM